MFPFHNFEGDAFRNQVVNCHTNGDKNNLAEVLYLEDVVEAYGLTSRKIIVNFFLKPSFEIFKCIFARLFEKLVLLRFLIVSRHHLRVLLINFLFHDIKEFSLKHYPFNFGEAILRRQIYALFVNNDV